MGSVDILRCGDCMRKRSAEKWGVIHSSFVEFRPSQRWFPWLSVQQRGMAGHATPLVVLKYPGIGEAPVVLEKLALVGPLGVVDPGHDRRVGIKVHPRILVGDQR